MATYCISDVHGNLKALCALLVKINYHYDGTDRLYLLGDYVDWGPSSIETLQFCMRLSKNPYITCLMGNHDQMFYNQIVASDCGRDPQAQMDTNWIYGNRGLDTWEQYMELPEEQRVEIRDWLGALPYAAEAQIGDDWYLLGHAGPFLPEEDISPEELEKKRNQAVWYRIRGPQVNPLTMLDEFQHSIWERKSYTKFICGHSITYHYRPFAVDEPFCIYNSDYFMDIDCGGKCMGLDMRHDTFPMELILQSRLAALRLDDMEEFYCDRSQAGYPMPGTEDDGEYGQNIDTTEVDKL